MSKNPFKFRPLKPIDIWGDQKNNTPRKSLAQRDRMLIWNNEFGTKDEAFCPICKKHKIYRTNFVAGHKKSLKNRGSNITRNFRPICTRCNSQMGDMNMNDFIKKYYPKKSTSTIKKRKTTVPKKKTTKKSTSKTTKSRK